MSKTSTTKKIIEPINNEMNEKIDNKKEFPYEPGNNVINNMGTLINVSYDIKGDNNLIELMQGCSLTNVKIFIRGNNHKLMIGENCKYSGGVIWFEDHHGQILIGQNTTIQSAHLAITEPYKTISIGEDCMFSNGIEFRTGDSHSIVDNETNKRINMAQNIEIGDHVWIGAHSTILKGVKIDSNTIIGTHSIVTSSIQNNSIASGVPAKVIRSNVNWLRERIYDV